MPIYDYQCKSCSKVTEFRMKFSDPHPTDCPRCGKGPLNKLLSKPNFKLNGTGWYETDFKGSNTSTSSNSGSTDSEPNSESTTEATTETKTKTETPSCSGCAYHDH